MKFLDLFQKVYIDDQYVRCGYQTNSINDNKETVEYVEFPGPIDTNKTNRVWDGKNHKEKSWDDWVLIPFVCDDVTEKDAANTILATVVDRNIIVLDEDCKDGGLSTRLIALLKNVLRRNGGGSTDSRFSPRLTDLFLSEKEYDNLISSLNENKEDFDSFSVFNVALHPIDNDEWDRILDYYLNALEGCPPELNNKRDIVIGVDNSAIDCFVNPIWKSTGKSGLAVLDNRRTILGFI